jgi:hypothetical protein
MKYKFFNQPSIFIATHSKPNVGIWQFPFFVSLTFGDGNLPNSLHFSIFNFNFTFWQNFTQKKDSL